MYKRIVGASPCTVSSIAEWTDCHEPNFRGDPLERLVSLRRTFFSTDHTLGQRSFPLIRQSTSTNAEFAKYRENVRWDLGGVTFVALHVTGSNNGLGRTATGDGEHSERNRANIEWSQQAFTHAKTHSRALVIFQHANMFTEFPPLGGKPQNPSGFASFRQHLQKEASGFGKPIVLVHADSHFARIDKPLSPRRSPEDKTCGSVGKFYSCRNIWRAISSLDSDYDRRKRS